MTFLKSEFCGLHENDQHNIFIQCALEAEKLQKKTKVSKVLVDTL